MSFRERFYRNMELSSIMFPNVLKQGRRYPLKAINFPVVEGFTNPNLKTRDHGSMKNVNKFLSRYDFGSNRRKRRYKYHRRSDRDSDYRKRDRRRSRYNDRERRKYDRRSKHRRRNGSRSEYIRDRRDFSRDWYQERNRYDYKKKAC